MLMHACMIMHSCMSIDSPQPAHEKPPTKIPGPGFGCGLPQLSTLHQACALLARHLPTTLLSKHDVPKNAWCCSCHTVVLMHASAHAMSIQPYPGKFHSAYCVHARLSPSTTLRLPEHKRTTPLVYLVAAVHQWGPP